MEIIQASIIIVKSKRSRDDFDKLLSFEILIRIVKDYLTDNK